MYIQAYDRVRVHVQCPMSCTIHARNAKPVNTIIRVEVTKGIKGPPIINDELLRAAFEELLVEVVVASSEIPEGVEPSVKLEPHCVCKDVA